MQMTGCAMDLGSASARALIRTGPWRVPVAPMLAKRFVYNIRHSGPYPPGLDLPSDAFRQTTAPTLSLQ